MTILGTPVTILGHPLQGRQDLGLIGPFLPHFGLEQGGAQNCHKGAQNCHGAVPRRSDNSGRLHQGASGQPSNTRDDSGHPL